MSTTAEATVKAPSHEPDKATWSGRRIMDKLNRAPTEHVLTRSGSARGEQRTTRPSSAQRRHQFSSFQPKSSCGRTPSAYSSYLTFCGEFCPSGSTPGLHTPSALARTHPTSAKDSHRLAREPIPKPNLILIGVLLRGLGRKCSARGSSRCHGGW